MQQSEKDKIFTQWVEEHSDKMYSWALHKTSIPEVAQDIVQDVFLSAYKSFDNFREDSKPRTWLLSILNNKIIDYYRKKGKSIQSSLDAEQDQEEQLEKQFFNQKGQWKNPVWNAEWQEEQHLLDNSEFNTALENCIDDLPENWAFVIRSKYIFNKEGKAIRQELGISSSNFWQITRRAKLMLKNCLDNNWFNDDK